MKKLGILALMVVLMAGIVYSVFDEPDTNDYVTGAKYIVNGTAYGVVLTAGCGNVTNVTVDYRVNGGSSYTLIGHNSSNDNITANWQLAFDTTSLKGDTTYSIRARLYDNNSNGSLCATDTEVVFKVDNTKPVCTFASALKSKGTYSPTQVWTITGTNANSATIQLGSNAIVAMAELSDTFTYSPTQGQVPEGVYATVKAETSDGLNTTKCTDLTYVQIDKGASALEVGAAVSAGKKGFTITSSGGNNLAIVIVLGLVALWYVRRKK